MKAVYDIRVSTAETVGAFDTGFDTVNLHEGQGGSLVPPHTCVSLSLCQPAHTGFDTVNLHGTKAEAWCPLIHSDASHVPSVNLHRPTTTLSSSSTLRDPEMALFTWRLFAMGLLASRLVEMRAPISTRSASERPAGAGARRAGDASRAREAAAAVARGASGACGRYAIAARAPETCHNLRSGREPSTVVSDMDAQVYAQQAAGARCIDEGEG